MEGAPGDTGRDAPGASLADGPVDAGVYWRPEIFASERERIFRTAWHCLGRDSELPEPGEYRLVELPGTGAELLYVRGDDGRLRAFHNACSHRAHPVVTQAAGRAQRFTCPFHAWCFDLRGRLVAIPDETGMRGLDRAQAGLRELPLERWQGFVFVCLAVPPARTVAEWLGEQGAGIVGYPFDAAGICFRYEAEVACNWKLFVDSFCETYHIPQLHRRSISRTYTHADNPHWHPVDVRLQGDHRTVGVWNAREHRLQAAQQLAREHAPPSVLDSLDTLPRGVNPTRSRNWAVDVCAFFPGWILVLGWNLFFTHQFRPLAADRTHWELSGWFRPAANVAQRFGQEHAMVELRDSVLEDAGGLERVQRNLSSGLVRELRLHEQELALRHHHAVLQRHLAGGSDA